MSYLNNFKYDVFLSYAHADNRTLNENEDGWITQFYKQFKLQLDRYLDGTNTAEIWCDHELRKNYAFDDRIENVIKNSAIFLAFTSNSFYRSEYCCDKELALFYKLATNGNLGLKIEDSNRLFQIQLLNKPHPLWPKEFQGVGCYEMFRYSNKNSIKKEEDQGITLSPELDPKEYNNRILEIVQDVSSTLKLIKNKQVPVVESSQPKAKKVFFSKVSHTLLSLREQIAQELEAHNIAVYKCELPPPWDKDEHNKAVGEKISLSDLSVHMFDGIAGDRISADQPTSFLQEQALTAKGLKKEQFIFVSQELDFDRIDDKNHGRFLSDFLTNKSQDDNYNLIREFSVPGIVDHIKEKLFAPPPPPPHPALEINNSILLDFNEVDFKYAFEYYNSLMLENRKIFLTIPGTGPLDSIKKFEIALKEVNTVIIVCVTAAQEWLKERIIEIIRAIRTEKSGILKISVYRDQKLNDLDLNTLCQFI